jgi:hypothetical protein
MLLLSLFHCIIIVSPLYNKRNHIHPIFLFSIKSDCTVIMNSPPNNTQPSSYNNPSLDYNVNNSYGLPQNAVQPDIVTEKKSNLPGYGMADTSGITPMQREQQQIQQQMQNNPGNGYPGVVGGTPAEFKGVQGYDVQGNPIIPLFIAQRHQIEQSLGPTCKDGSYHDLRMHLTTKSLFFAILIIPYCCGWRGSRITVCKKCHQKFPQIILPSAPQQ